MPKANPLPPLELLREYFDFSPDGIVTLRKKTGPKDSRRKVGDTLGHIGAAGYLRVWFFKTEYLVHRLVFYHHFGWCPPIIDHKDCNLLNNRPSNLRPATVSQNSINRKKGMRGAYWAKTERKWIVQIRIDGKRRRLGRFDSKADAHAAYCCAATETHGEFFKA